MSLDDRFTNNQRVTYLTERTRLSYLDTEKDLLTEEEGCDGKVVKTPDTTHTFLNFNMAVDSTGDETKWQQNVLCLKRSLRILILIVLIVGYYVYVGFSLYLNPGSSVLVCMIAVLLGLYLLDTVSRRRLRSGVTRVWGKVKQKLKVKRRTSVWTRRITTVACVLAILAFLIYDIQGQWNRYIPLGGLTFFIILSVLFSTDPKKINWIPVIWGLILQFCLGLLILRWEPGFTACKWLGQQVSTFLSYADEGSKFVFGEKYLDHPVAFQILPVVVFFSATVNVLYYLGVMQLVIKAIAVVLQAILLTTPIESFATAAHIFIGLVESSVVLKPFWSRLTISEIHATMTGGCATVAGTVIAAYISFGVPPEHLITASFMSAPAALAIAKISLPETEESKIKSQKEIKTPTSSEVSLIEALTAGAGGAIKLVAYIVVNLIAFLAVLAFLDKTLSYIGARVNFPQLSFQLICSYVFMPLAAIIGVPWEECDVVGTLIGKKIIVNEFLAFIDLGTLIKAGEISDFSGTVATYCLCGFGSIVAIGINLASLTSAEPSRRSDFARLSVRSIINGNIACLMTACIASLLYKDIGETDTVSSVVNATISQASNITETLSTVVSPSNRV